VAELSLVLLVLMAPSVRADRAQQSTAPATDKYTPPAIVIGGATGKMKGHGNQHVAANRAPTANLLLNIAEMADIAVEKIGPSTGRLSL
jgi:hypothetical protein